MEYYDEHDLWEQEYIERNILDLLYSMKRNAKNHALLTEYFLHEFSRDPESIISIMRLIKEHLEDENNPNREKLARRYLSMFSFLCERFGLYWDKLELDDLCFSITQSDEYKRLVRELDRYRKKSEKVIQQIQNSFYDKLSDVKREIEIYGRYKNILSIYKKCKKKKIKDALRLWDIFAFRIIVDGESEDCFDIAHHLHDSFIPLPKRYKDYISIPKINGYQSIHTWLIGVIDDLDLAIEVQIRTVAMDEIARSGIAAHYLYATSKSAKLVTDKEKKLIEHLEEIAEKIPKNPYIYCLSPLWDILRLTRWSNVADFAFKIHSSLPKKAKYALVNNKRSRLESWVKNFDTIEIITT